MPRPRIRTAELRDQVLRDAGTVLEQEGPDGLRARQLASSTGTSTAALYELFGDKAGLVQALFYDGFRQLHARLQQLPQTADAEADLTAMLQVSRAFAVEQPMRFDLMYSRRFGEFSPSAADLRAGTGIYDLVVSRVERWLVDAGAATDPVDAAHALIAVNRGLVAAELAGLLGRSREARDRRWQLAITAQLEGLKATSRRR